MLLVYYPRCSTCQRAVRWLEAHGLRPELRDIKLENPDSGELRAWQARSGLPLKRFFNTSGMLYRELGLRDRLPAMTEEEQLALLASDGMLVKRPLLITEDAVLAGFREAAWESTLIH